MPVEKKQPALTLYRYTGDGAFYSGVPACDLTPEQYAAIPEYARELYTAPYEAPAAPAVAEAETTKTEAATG